MKAYFHGWRRLYQNSSRWFWLSFLCLGCSTLRMGMDHFDPDTFLRDSPIFSTHHTGFALYDFDQKEMLVEHNASLRFTPASNTKLLTMYAVLNILPDSLPSLLFSETDTGLHIKPVGDPTFLHSSFRYQPAYELLNSHKRVYLHFTDRLPQYGTGWAWDDYLYDFQAEINWFPIYGNTVHIQKSDSTLKITPTIFQDSLVEIEDHAQSKVSRAQFSNVFSARINLKDTASFKRTVPFKTSQSLIVKMLSDTLHSTIILEDTAAIAFTDTLFSQPRDEVLSAMLKPSDNFLAEQLLVQCAWYEGELNTQKFISKFKNKYLAKSREIVWVDGSGLSRYNLISPLDLIQVLNRTIEEEGWDRVASLLPKGGEGTLENLYKSEVPYIFAKTGTLSNNHNLSGLLITRSGRRLLFSLINNHYVRPKREVEKALEAFIAQIRMSY
ncbi:MAG: D-alanyl-D-alanine carboxypeptidase [Bacteroidota bacterium]